ncbi:hypothetical protein SCP_0212710 [Sparassis crispa]|uniref:Uncharacterized protein n=1 Tax=Sparassis crispa TaxID=139825 RepID=A0A401GD06_9APHY|nr:hypothetical protein SCP_0212710 [Sparassis crispa]GBE80068.1 hypothetical protein SCP_0212710 [Sparassis crispa]
MPPRTRSALDASEPRQTRSHTKGVQKVSTASESRPRNSAKKKKDVSPPKDEGHPATDGSKQKSSRTSKTTDVADEEAAESVAQHQGKAKLPAKRDTKARRTSPSDSDGGDGKSVAPASEDDGIDAPSNNDKDTNLDSAEPDAHAAANLHRSVDEADAYNEDESSEEPAGNDGLHEEHGRTDVDRGGDQRVPNTEDSEDGAIYSDTQTIDEPMPGNRDRKLVLRKPTKANQPYVMLPKLRDIRHKQDTTHDAVRKQQPQGQIPDDSMSDGGSDGGFALSSEGDYDMSEYSGSDYSETKKVELMRRENHLRRHQEDVNTEQDDDLLDKEMVDDVVTELEVHGLHARTLEKRNDLRMHSRTVHGKGKQHVVQLDEAEEIAEQEAVAGSANWQKSTGPFSKQARAAAVTFGEVVMREAENLAQKHGKSTRDVLILAGLSFKPSHAANPANKYRQWYSYHHPKADNVTTADYLKEVNTTYKKMFEGVDGQNDEQRALVMKLILDFCDSIEKDPSLAKHSMQSITARMLSAKDQFTALAASYRNLADMEVVGAILYMGTDAGGWQTSAIFGGSSAVKRLIEDNQVDVRKMVDDLTTAIKAVNLNEGGFSLPSSFGRVDVNAQGNEAPRDHFHRVFMAMMQQNLQKFEEAATKCVRWKDWMKTASTYKLCIVDWPPAILALGPDFEFRSLNAAELKVLTDGFIEACQKGRTNIPILHIIRWDQADIDLPDDDPRKGKGLVTLVKDTKGNRLRVLRDIAGWARIVAHAAPKGRCRHVSPVALPSSSESEELPTPNVRPVRGLPPRARSVVPARTINTDIAPPRKHRREASSDGSDIEEISPTRKTLGHKPQSIQGYEGPGQASRPPSRNHHPRYNEPSTRGRDAQCVSRHSRDHDGGAAHSNNLHIMARARMGEASNYLAPPGQVFPLPQDEQFGGGAQYPHQVPPHNSLVGPARPRIPSAASSHNDHVPYSYADQYSSRLPQQHLRSIQGLLPPPHWPRAPTSQLHASHRSQDFDAAGNGQCRRDDQSTRASGSRPSAGTSGALHGAQADTSRAHRVATSLHESEPGPSRRVEVAHPCQRVVSPIYDEGGYDDYGDLFDGDDKGNDWYHEC